MVIISLIYGEWKRPGWWIGVSDGIIIGILLSVTVIAIYQFGWDTTMQVWKNATEEAWTNITTVK